MVSPRKTRGQSLVEFALIIPLAVFVITIFFDLGRLVYYSSTLNNAVREGTRFAIARTTVDDDTIVKDRVKAYAIGMNTNNITVTVKVLLNSSDPEYATCPDCVIVKAIYTFKPVTPGLSMLLHDGNVSMEAKSSMIIAPRYQN